MTAREALHTYYKDSRQTQPDLAIALNVSQTTVHNWLSGKTNIPLEHYAMISKLSGVDLVELLPEDWRPLLVKSAPF